MKRIVTVFVSILCVLTLLVCGISAERVLPLVVDNADLLTSDEETLLTNQLDALSQMLEIEIAVVTVNSTDGKSAMQYADDFYDYNGYGYGENDDGALLLIDMGKREWWITTHGYGAYYLNDYALYQIEESIIDYLSDGNFYAAFLTFSQMCEYYIEDAKNSGTAPDDEYYGEVTDEFGDDYYGELPDEFWDDYYEEPSTPFEDAMARLGISLVAGFIIALIMVLTMRSGMKTVKSAYNAANYVVNGSLNLRVQRDHYLYTNTVRTRRESSSSSSGSSRSGSSSHRSSSGRSHGGRGGRF